MARSKRKGVEPAAEVVLPTETAPAQVSVANAGDVQRYVPIRGGELRLGPKESATVESVVITEDTRRLENQGRIFIRNL